VERPYFEATNGDTPVFDFMYTNDIRVKIGSVHAFSPEEIARIIQEQAINYILQKTMGRHFPAHNDRAVEELEAIMIGGFDPDRIVVSFEQATDEGINPVASVQAHFGLSSTPLYDTISHRANNNHSPVASSLATFQSMEIISPTCASPTLASLLQRAKHLSEQQVVCMSRLFRQDPTTSEKLGIQVKSLAWDAMAFLGIGIATHALRTGKHPLPELVVYDTHTRKIQDCLSQFFGMELFAIETEVKPTEAVLATILSNHYGENGYRGKIFLGFAELSTYVQKAVEYLNNPDRAMEGNPVMNITGTEIDQIHETNAFAIPQLMTLEGLSL